MRVDDGAVQRKKQNTNDFYEEAHEQSAAGLAQMDEDQEHEYQTDLAAQQEYEEEHGATPPSGDPTAS